MKRNKSEEVGEETFFSREVDSVVKEDEAIEISKGDSYVSHWKSSAETDNTIMVDDNTEEVIIEQKNVFAGNEAIQNSEINKDNVKYTPSYVPRWKSSSTEIDETNIEDGSAEEDDIEQETMLTFEEELPIFADDFSKELHLETKRLEKKRDDAAKKAKDHKERVVTMKEHLHNVQQEINHTNGLLAAMKNEIQTEEHLLSLLKNENSRHRRDIEKLDSASNSERERLKIIQKQIHKANEDMDSMKESMNWNQDELEKWVIAASSKEEDNLALQKYTRSDEVKIKELTLAIERLTKFSVAKKAQLENEMTETQTCQTELEKTAENFKAQHDERRQLVKQWQETIETMQRRDKDIDEISKKYAKEEKDKKSYLKLLQKNKERLLLVEAENEDMQQSIDTSEQIKKMRKQEHLSLQTAQQAFKDELDALKYESVASASSLLNKRTEKDLAQNELNEKKKQLERFRESCESIKKRLEEEKKATTSREKSAKDMERFLADQEKNLKQAESNIQALKDKMFTDSQHLAKLRKEESNFIAEIKNARATSKNLAAKLHILGSESTRQQELIYNAEFQILQIEKKIAHGLGERSEEENQKLQARIELLSDELGCIRENQKYLNQQSRRLKFEMRTWDRRKTQCQSQKEEIEEKINEIQLEISSCEMRLQQVIIGKEEAMVSNDIMKLDVRRLRDALKCKADEVYSLEKRRDQIVLSMTERKGEMKIEAEVQLAQLRAIEEERHKSALDLGQRRLVAEKLGAKCEILRKTNHPESDGSEEEHSQVYFMIQAALKKEELQREGDKLDQEIRKKEKEIKTLKKMMTHLKEKNTEYRLSFAKADGSSGVVQEVMRLEEQVQSSQEDLFKKKMDLQYLDDGCKEDLQRLKEIRLQAEQLDAQNQHLISARNQVKEENDKCTKNIQETSERLIELSCQYRDKINQPKTKLSVQEIVIYAEVMDSNVSIIMHNISNISHDFPEIRMDLEDDITKEGLSMVQ